MTTPLVIYSRIGGGGGAPLAHTILRPGLFGQLPIALPHGPGPLHHLAWRAGGGGVEGVYIAEGDPAIAHYSYVVRKDFRFPFMGRDELHIGPCWTAPVARGRGLFPAMLQQIAHDFPGKRLWMFTQVDNHASRAGIAKAGFAEVGSGRRIGRRYLLDGAR